MTTHYELGAREIIENTTSPIITRTDKENPIMGIKVYVRDEKAGDYVRIYETAPTIWVDDEPQAWSSGNFETMESARHLGTKAYRYINQGARA